MGDFLASEILTLGMFGLFALATLGGAGYLFFSKNILYGAYGLLVSLMGVAGLFLMAGAEFIAVSQIMIYVGGILILVMFGIMLSANVNDKKKALSIENVNSLLSIIIGLIIAVGLGCVVLNLELEDGPVLDTSVNQVNALGMSLMTNQVLLLELIGVLLLVVLIGASYIAKKTDQ